MGYWKERCKVIDRCERDNLKRFLCALAVPLVLYAIATKPWILGVYRSFYQLLGSVAIKGTVLIKYEKKISSVYYINHKPKF